LGGWWGGGKIRVVDEQHITGALRRGKGLETKRRETRRWREMLKRSSSWYQAKRRHWEGVV
jgi:hypothetical protein